MYSLQAINLNKLVFHLIRVLPLIVVSCWSDGVTTPPLAARPRSDGVTLPPLAAPPFRRCHPAPACRPPPVQTVSPCPRLPPAPCSDGVTLPPLAARPPFRRCHPTPASRPTPVQPVAALCTAHHAITDVCEMTISNSERNPHIESVTTIIDLTYFTETYVDSVSLTCKKYPRTPTTKTWGLKGRQTPMMY